MPSLRVAILLVSLVVGLVAVVVVGAGTGRSDTVGTGPAFDERLLADGVRGERFLPGTRAVAHSTPSAEGTRRR